MLDLNIMDIATIVWVIAAIVLTLITILLVKKHGYTQNTLVQKIIAEGFMCIILVVPLHHYNVVPNQLLFQIIASYGWVYIVGIMFIDYVMDRFVRVW